MIDHAIAAAPPLDRPRRQLLEHLEWAGPLPVAELPRRWPLTGYHVRLVIRQLTADGLVEVHRNGRYAPRIDLTQAGRLALGEPGREP